MWSGFFAIIQSSYDLIEIIIKHFRLYSQARGRIYLLGYCYLIKSVMQLMLFMPFSVTAVIIFQFVFLDKLYFCLHKLRTAYRPWGW